MCSFVNDLPENGLWGLKHVAGVSQNNIFMVTQAISWIKYYMVICLHGIWTTINLNVCILASVN